MIRLYNSDRTAVIKILNPITAVCKREHLGSWIEEITHENNEAGASIERGMYIEVPTPKGLQFFKVRMIDKLNENTIRVTAFHRMYDLSNNYVKDTNIVGKTRKQAVEQILNNTLRPTGFTVQAFTGNTTNNLRIVGYDPFTAIVGDKDNTVINRFGGEWDFDNSKIILEDVIGQDRGYLVTWNKNMTELNEKLDDTELVTQIVPIGRDRLMLPELTVDSLYVNNYEDVYTREITFSDIGVDEEKKITEAQAQELLRLAAKKYFRDTECDLIKGSYSVNIKDVKNNPKYSVCSFFYNLDIGDYVTILKSNGIRIKVRLLRYEFDSINDEFLSFELNSTTKKMTSNTTNTQQAINNILNSNGSVNSEKLEGLINLLQVSMGAMVSGAEKHRSKAILFEDRVLASDSYGAMAIGTKGFMIASEFNAAKNDWNWRTFGTGQGFVADYITAGTLNADLIKAGVISSLNEDTVINITNGHFNFANKLIWDGTKMVMSGNFIQYAYDGKKSVEIQNNTVNFYDWEKDGDYIGAIYAGRSSNVDYGHLSIRSDTGNPVFIACGDSAEAPIIVLSDNGVHAAPISMWEDVQINGNLTVTGTINGTLAARVSAMENIKLQEEGLI